MSEVASSKMGLRYNFPSRAHIISNIRKARSLEYVADTQRARIMLGGLLWKVLGQRARNLVPKESISC